MATIHIMNAPGVDGRGSVTVHDKRDTLGINAAFSRPFRQTLDGSVGSHPAGARPRQEEVRSSYRALDVRGRRLLL